MKKQILSYAALAAATFLPIAASPATRAADSIVYSARYYSPGSKAITHFHLYEVSPGGSGKRQLTFGNNDETEPAVSPDGRRIAYQRRDSVFVLDTRTRRTTALPNLFTRDQTDTKDQTVDKLRWNPDSRSLVVFTSAGDTSTAVVCDGATGNITARWEGLWNLIPSPDGKHALKLTEELAAVVPGFNGNAQDVANLPHGLIHGCWLDNSTVALYNASATSLEIIPLHGERRHVTLTTGAPLSEDFKASLSTDNTQLIRIPGDSGHVIVRIIMHNSTQGAVADFYIADVKTGQMTAMTEGTYFLVPDPGGKRYASAPGRDLSPLPAPKRGHTADREHNVWTAPLQIGTFSAGAKPKAIQDGLVCVQSADWRR